VHISTEPLGYLRIHRLLSRRPDVILLLDTRANNTSSTVGAGDTFIAGILYSYLAHLQDWQLPQKLEFANKLAGRKVVQEGFAGLGAMMRDVHGK
jgi:fructose-1-phosphate kinase PfkB-like protein